jgi:uncharacterized SAM-binding protein YcdF (DUF218 family)
MWCISAPLLATYLIVRKPLERADAIMVLSGAAVYTERTQKAAELYRQGVAPIVFISDDGGQAGWTDAENTNLPFVELESRELIANGVPTEAIRTLPVAVAGTGDEATAMRAEADKRPLNSLLIVTSAYHTRRTLRTFEKLFAGTDIKVGIDAPPPGDRTPAPAIWWLYYRGWQTVAGEYVKMAVYYFYY